MSLDPSINPYTVFTLTREQARILSLSNDAFIIEKSLYEPSICFNGQYFENCKKNSVNNSNDHILNFSRQGLLRSVYNLNCIYYNDISTPNLSNFYTLPCGTSTTAYNIIPEFFNDYKDNKPINTFSIFHIPEDQTQSYKYTCIDIDMSPPNEIYASFNKNIKSAIFKTCLYCPPGNQYGQCQPQLFLMQYLSLLNLIGVDIINNRILGYLRDIPNSSPLMGIDANDKFIYSLHSEDWSCAQLNEFQTKLPSVFNSLNFIGPSDKSGEKLPFSECIKKYPNLEFNNQTSSNRPIENPFIGFNF